MAVAEKDLQIASVVAKAIEHHGAAHEALIPILSEVNQALGYIPAEAFREIRDQVNQPENDVIISESHLFSLATFYHMLSTKPLGEHVIRFCESAPCHVVGGRNLLLALQDNLKIAPGETTPDNKWSLITTSCLGVCAVGPVMLVDGDIYGNVTPDQVPGILAKYQ